MDDTALIEQIVTEVLKRLRQKQKQALALFTGGTIGAQAGLEALRRLQEQGWALQVVLTPGAERALGSQGPNHCLPGVTIFTEKNGWPPGPLLKENNVILVPVLTLNTAAKIAVGMADNLVTTLILEGLLMGKPVLAAKDACDVDNPVRSQLGMDQGAPALRRMLNNNLECLAAYGIQLVPAAELAAAASRLVESFPGKVKAGARENQPQPRTVFAGGVLSRKDIVSCVYHAITVSKDTVITPLARDLARERGIPIIIN